MDNTIRKIKTTASKSLIKCGYANNDSKLIVAVSGGPDSTVLIHCLSDLSASLGIHLHIAHLNHNLRGKESVRDAHFVGEIADKLKIPSTIETTNSLLDPKRQNNSSIEDRARKARYKFLHKVAIKHKGSAIALGHTADDQSETILMNLIRGSGIHGLRGMKEIASYPGNNRSRDIVLFRPFLELTRNDILGYCKNLKLEYCLDSSNESLNFTRNHIRKKLIPSLELYNPRVKESIRRIGRATSLATDYMDSIVHQLWPSIGMRKKDSVILDIDKLKSLHTFEQKLIIRHSYEKLTGSTKRLSESHIESVANMVNKPGNSRIFLPGQVTVENTYNIIGLYTHSLKKIGSMPKNKCFNLSIPGTSNIPGWIITATEVSNITSLNVKNPFTSYFDLDSLGTDIHYRNREDGDHFRPLGMNNIKKLQNFFVDSKIPRIQRDTIPLMVSTKGIIWVVGHRIAEWCKVTEHSKHIIKVEWVVTEASKSSESSTSQS